MLMIEKVLMLMAAMQPPAENVAGGGGGDVAQADAAGSDSAGEAGVAGGVQADAASEVQESGETLDPARQLEELADGAMQLLGPTIEQTSMYGWFGLLAAILIGVVFGRIVAAVLQRAAHRLKERGWIARAALCRHAAGPANLAIVTIGVMIGLQVIVLAEGLRAVSSKVISLLLIVSIAWFLYNVVAMVDIPLRRLLRRTDPKLVETVVAMVRKALRIFLMVMFGMFVIQNIFEQNITAWLAGLGIAGLAVSLAAQDPIKNIFGSFTVIAERPFVLGDRVIFTGIDGTVEEIGFRSTRIRTLTGHLVTVPNMKFTDNVIENITRRPSVRRIMNVTVTYDTPPEKVQEGIAIIKDIFDQPDIKAGLNLPDQPPRVVFNDFNSESLNIFVIYWYAINREGNDWWTYMAHAENLNLKLLRAFNEAGIDFAFPTRTLYLAGDPKRELNLHLEDVRSADS